MNKHEYILAVNAGSTSTKLALYDGETEVIREALSMTPEEVARFDSVLAQTDFRKGLIEGFLRKQGMKASDLSMVASISGSLPGVEKGAYLINNLMVDVLVRFPVFDHPATIGCLVAHAIAQEAGVTAVIYDSNTTDELPEMAKLTGIKGLKRIATSHVLNARAMARKLAREMGGKYEDYGFVVAHLGGGVSLAAHDHGRIIDDIFDDEGPMCPQRCGAIPAYQMVELCCSGTYTEDELKSMVRGKGGMMSLLGTQDTREIEERIAHGDEEAREAYQAMAYQVAKGIGQMAVAMSGKVDRIILTGGTAYSEMFTRWIKQRVEFIAPVVVIPGEREMEALAMGALRVLRGEEIAKDYDVLPEGYVAPKDCGKAACKESEVSGVATIRTCSGMTLNVPQA